MATANGIRLAISKMLEKQHATGGNRFPGDNPSSGMHHFLKAVGAS